MDSPTVPIQGSCDEQFAAVRAEFERNFSERGDVGASVCAYVDDRQVVDLWGGYADDSKSRPWRSDTLACVASTGKGMAALCLLRLVDRGFIDVDAPVVRYWPEFGTVGKSRIPVRWLLSHRAGLPAIRRDMTPESMYAWHPFTEVLAQEAPWWDPGTRHGYHALTFGFLVGEIVRRVAGTTIGEYLRSEIAAPLGADFFIGVPASEDARAARMFTEPPPPAGEISMYQTLLSDPASMAARAFFNPPRPPQGMNTREWRAAEIPASNGHATARGIARIYSELALDAAFDARRLIGGSTLEQAVQENSYGPDAVLPLVSRYGLGFWLPTPDTSYAQRPRAFGHPGRGGSVGFADPEARVGFGYVPNQYQGSTPSAPDLRARALIDALYAALQRR